MKQIKPIIILILLVLWLSPFLPGTVMESEQVKVLAMCRPTISQVKNIEVLFEKNLITLDQLKLVCIYHENELTDYKPARQYVKENNLNWVTFISISGEVELPELFKENAWTPQFKKIFKKTSGIIFTGGMDIPPSIYGEENSLLTEATTPVRTHYEVSFLFHLLGSSRNPGFIPFLEEDKDYPVLGICLGLQTMNVATGGSLIQDIPSQVYGLKTLEQVLKQKRDRIHSFRYVKNLYAAEKNLVPTFHPIKIKKNSIYVKHLKLKKGDTPFVLSSHHQGVKLLGKNLFVTATSMDGKIIETLEHKNYKNVLGVQYHPEAYSLYSKSKIYKEKPGDEEKFNIRRFLLANPPSMELHRNLWEWFSGVLR